jgi:putative transposase
MLKRRGIEPAPERTRKTTWKEFLTQHWELIVAADFFTVEVWTKRRLQRFLVLCFMELSTRKVEIAGVATSADGMWMSQIGRNLSDAVDGTLHGKRYLVHELPAGYIDRSALSVSLLLSGVRRDNQEWRFPRGDGRQ